MPRGHSRSERPISRDRPDKATAALAIAVLLLSCAAATAASLYRPVEIGLWSGWFASMAYVLRCALRRLALQRTQFAKASCGTDALPLQYFQVV